MCGVGNSQAKACFPLATYSPYSPSRALAALGLAQEGHFLRDLPLSEAEPGIPRGTCPAPGPSRISFQRFL